MLRSIGINQLLTFAFNNVDTDVLTRHIALDDCKNNKGNFLKNNASGLIKNIIES